MHLFVDCPTTGRLDQRNPLPGGCCGGFAGGQTIHGELWLLCSIFPALYSSCCKDDVNFGLVRRTNSSQRTGLSRS